MGNGKKMVNRTYQACVTAQGYKQICEQHNNQDNCSLPVVMDSTILIVLVLIIIAGWHCCLMDNLEAFLKCEFKNSKAIHMKVPQGFEKLYMEGTVLKLL